MVQHELAFVFGAVEIDRMLSVGGGQTSSRGRIRLALVSATQIRRAT